MNCTGRPLDHFIGHKRMNSITLVVQEHFSSWVKIAKCPFKNLASSSHSTEKEHILIIFPFSPPLRTSSQSKLASLARALFYSLAIHHPSLSISLPFAFKLIVRTFIFAVWTERTSLTMASICPDPDGSLLSQFPSILLLHINSGQDYLPACLSRCSRETGKKRERKKEHRAFLLVSLLWEPWGDNLLWPYFIHVSTGYSYWGMPHSCRKLKGIRNTHSPFLMSLELQKSRQKRNLYVSAYVIYSIF